jgi:hypothetical protein
MVARDDQLEPIAAVSLDPSVAGEPGQSCKIRIFFVDDFSERSGVVVAVQVPPRIDGVVLVQDDVGGERRRNYLRRQAAGQQRADEVEDASRDHHRVL